MTNNTTYIRVDGELITIEESGSSLLDHGLHYGIGPVTRTMQALYQDLVHGRLPQHSAWLTPVTKWAA